MFSRGSLSSFARRKKRTDETSSGRRSTVERKRTARIGVGCVGAAVGRWGCPARSTGACGARAARTRSAGRSTRRGRTARARRRRAARARRRRAASRAARSRSRRRVVAAAVGGSRDRDGRAEREERRATEATSRKQRRGRCLQSKRVAAKRARGLARANVASTGGARNEVVHGVIFSGSSSSTKSKRP